METESRTNLNGCWEGKGRRRRGEGEEEIGDARAHFATESKPVLLRVHSVCTQSEQMGATVRHPGQLKQFPKGQSSPAKRARTSGRGGQSDSHFSITMATKQKAPDALLDFILSTTSKSGSVG